MATVCISKSTPFQYDLQGFKNLEVFRTFLFEMHPGNSMRVCQNIIFLNIAPNKFFRHNEKSDPLYFYTGTVRCCF